MYYIGLDVHKKTISYCVKDVTGHIQQQGAIAATRTELDSWMKTSFTYLFLLHVLLQVGLGFVIIYFEE